MAFRDAIGDIRLMNTLFSTAEDIAHDLGDAVPGAEHLLLAALGLDDDSGRRAFAAFDVSADDVRRAIGATHSDALGSLGLETETVEQTISAFAGRKPHGAYQVSGTAQTMFQRAVALSKSDRPKVLRAAHLVIAASELEHGTSALVLRQLGVDRSALAAAARVALVA